MERVKEIILKIIEVIILITIALISFYNQMDLTMFMIPFSHAPLLIIYKLLPIIVLIKAVLLWKEKALWLSLPAALVMYYAFPTEHYYYQAFFCFLIVGCVGIQIKKIFCAAFIPATLVIVNMMVASLSGAITSLAVSSRGIRSYWGHISPTDFGTAVLFIVIFAWILFKEIPEEYFLILSLFSLYISFYITGSNTSGYLTILFMLVLVWRGLEERVILKRDNLRWIISVTNIIMRIAFPALGLFMIVTVFAYYKQIPFTSTLNTVLHKRLETPADMFAIYGLKPFGTYFDMFGNGGSIIGMITEYTFIDSTYPQILIRYGWVTYIVANILWVFTTDRAIRVNNRRLAFAMTLVAFDFIMEHHWYELCYDAFVIIPFADFGIKEASGKDLFGAIRQNFEDKKYRITFGVIGIVCLVITYLSLTFLFSYLRTIFNGYGYADGGEGAKTVFVVVTVVVILLLAIVLSICNSISIYVTKKAVSWKSAIVLGAAAVITLAMFIKGNAMLDVLTVDLSARIEPEKDIINIITTSAEGKVYVDKLPEAYIRSELNIDRAFYSGEDLARSSCATVVVDAPLDYYCFTSRGFLYLQISEQDAIYTNDDKVIEALKDEGYVLRGYNSYVNQVDLDYTAEINGYEQTPDGGILLGENSHSFTSLPKVDLLRSIYTVKFKLRVENVTYEDDNKLGDVWVTAYDGEEELARASVMRSLFDENGELEYEMSFKDVGRNIEFKASVDGDNKFEIVSIELLQTPDYDVHVKVDNLGRAIHSEYYDLDGNPKEMPGGYYGVENSYNKNDLPIYTRYLGGDFEPVIISSGYCALRTEYDRSKHIIKISYYDEDDNPILLQDGCQYLTREYDFVGNVICEGYYGMFGEPVLKRGLYHKIIRDYDDEKHVTKESYLGTDGNPIPLSDGAAAYSYEYDENNNIVKLTYLGTDGNPVINAYGYASYRRWYNSENQITREEYFDEKDNPILCSRGQWAVEYEYDEEGNVVKLTYLGLEGTPIINTSGYSICRRSYNSTNKLIREEYYDTEEKPIVLSIGQFAVEYEYDESGANNKKKYFDIEGKLIAEE